MTEDLTPRKGRVFIGPLTSGGKPKLCVVKAARTRRDGTHSSCVLLTEEPGVGGHPLYGEYRMTLPLDGQLRGFRRVTLAQVGIARDVSANTGRSVPTDAVCIVTRDRTGGTTDVFNT
ncbi:MAG: hypothetical protein QOF36_2625 [Microbacteriaceae bacterium]|jgi:hypothetical protein|nr:hypothetical protein [Microbacteriaceae bacterium]